MNKLLGLLFAVFFCVSVSAEEAKSSFTDDMMFSITAEKGTVTGLQYGYFYATKPWTDKLSSTYSASVAIDSATSEHLLDMYSQTLTVNYSLTDNLSVYMLNDINPHFERTETWVGTTLSW
ncbi:MAG: hypothetical protein CMG35_11530 [Candidatus Marinimicrobia bacterium]|jgi:uncharacterized membrane protein|nr:hypothetical protein [Candidatus Neomarinimicrobiota bacterium]MBO03260.1 hypothetical protein [Candidatus Neomarinimicrobiota bacterium]|tara:strand:- start:5768 stop:6130 length:363 start_codon:yes stop_codon:yes gene_type:complete